MHHLKDVLRLKIRDRVMVFDGKGNEYECSIEKILPENAAFKIHKIHKRASSKIKVTIACAIPKGQTMDSIIDKLTQLGVERIIPLETERVIIKLDRQKKAHRHQRWMKIGLNASLQSQRNALPMIEPVKNLEELLSQADNYDLKLIPTLSGRRRALRDVLAKTKAKNILVLIGPEGDFTSEEVALAQMRGFIPVSLGDLVLRVETAAVAVAGFIKFYLNI